MTLIVWDTSILPPQGVGFEQDIASRSGGPSVLGNEQVVVSAAGRWRATYTVKISSIRHRLAYRSWKAASNGRAGTWLIPTCSGFQVMADAAGLSDAFALSDIFVPGNIFADTDGAFPIDPAAALVTAGGIRGARSLAISMSDQTPPSPGLYFSTGSGGTKSLYLISSVTRTGGNAYTLVFWPGLRQAVAIGDPVDFATPACRMRLVSDNTGAMNLDLLRFATVSLDFIEDFPA